MKDSRLDREMQEIVHQFASVGSLNINKCDLLSKEPAVLCDLEMFPMSVPTYAYCNLYYKFSLRNKTRVTQFGIAHLIERICPLVKRNLYSSK